MISRGLHLLLRHLINSSLIVSLRLNRTMPGMAHHKYNSSPVQPHRTTAVMRNSLQPMPTSPFSPIRDLSPPLLYLVNPPLAVFHALLLHPLTLKEVAVHGLLLPTSLTIWLRWATRKRLHASCMDPLPP